MGNRNSLIVGMTISNWKIVEVLPVQDGIRWVQAECRLCGSIKKIRYNNIARTLSCGCAERRYVGDPDSSDGTRPCDRCSSASKDGCSRALGNYKNGKPRCEPYRSWLSAEWRRVTTPFKRLGQKG